MLISFTTFLEITTVVGVGKGGLMVRILKNFTGVPNNYMFLRVLNSFITFLGMTTEVGVRGELTKAQNFEKFLVE